MSTEVIGFDEPLVSSPQQQECVTQDAVDDEGNALTVTYLGTTHDVRAVLPTDSSWCTFTGNDSPAWNINKYFAFSPYSRDYRIQLEYCTDRRGCTDNAGGWSAEHRMDLGDHEGITDTGTPGSTTSTRTTRTTLANPIRLHTWRFRTGERRAQAPSWVVTRFPDVHTARKLPCVIFTRVLPLPRFPGQSQNNCGTNRGHRVRVPCVLRGQVLDLGQLVVALRTRVTM